MGATLAALTGIGEAIEGRVILIAGGQGKGQDFSPLGEPARQYLRAALVLGQDADKVADGLSGVPCERVADMAAAVKAAGNECAFVDRSINTDVAGANELASQNIHKADAVLMLPGWEGHASCKFELDVAIAIDRNVLYFDTNLSWHKIGGKDIYGVFVKYPLDDEEDA